MGIKRGKTKRPDIIPCLSFKHTHTHNQNKASPSQALKGGTLLAEIIALYLLLLELWLNRGTEGTKGNEVELQGRPWALNNSQKAQCVLPGERSVYFKISHLINA